MNNQITFQDVDLVDQDFVFHQGQKGKKRHVNFQTKYQTQEQSTTTTVQQRTIKFQVESEQINKAYQNEENAQMELSEFQAQKLNLFLRSIYPLIESALNEPFKINFNPISSETNRDNIELYTLTNDSLKNIADIDTQLEITDIQWNSNGLTISASYGSLQHDGTCQHKSVISSWNISKRDFKQNHPTFQLETDACIMCLAYHPYKPNILAAGSYTGQIILFDLQTQIAISEIDEYFHRESITQLQWNTNINSQLHHLISLGSDGKILIWPINFENHEKCLKYPLKGFNLLRKKENQIEGVGGICFSQCQEDLNNFVIGSEGGSVLRGLINPISYDKKQSSLISNWKEESQFFMNNINQRYVPEIKNQVETYCKQRNIHDIQVKQIINAKPEIRKLYTNPISFAYEAHYGTVFGISSSSFIKNVFITCSMDGSIRIYEMNTARCITSYEYLGMYILSVQFSQTRPNVFGACTSSGQILLFDLTENKKKEYQIIQPTNIQSGFSATNIRFNSRQKDLIACSYQGGSILIYQLCDQLVTYQDKEENELIKFLSEQSNN